MTDLAIITTFWEHGGGHLALILVLYFRLKERISLVEQSVSTLLQEFRKANGS